LPDPIFFTGSGPFGPRMYVADRKTLTVT